MKQGLGARTIVVAPLLISGLLVSGCMSSPTYGTGVSSNEQLANDLSSMFSMAPKRTTADYAPRPDLVKPTKATTELPAPQDSIVTADSGQWPESPEQRRARIRAEATENRDDPNFQSEIVNDLSPAAATSTRTRAGKSEKAMEAGVQTGNLQHQGAAFRAARDASKQSDPTVRKTLTEPPLEYRKPAETAPTDDLGESEFKKQRRLSAEAKGKKSWKDIIPWL